MLFVPFKLVLFIHSLAWPASELGWVEYEGSGVVFVCIVSFRLSSVTNVFCLLLFLSTFAGLLESEED